MKKYDIDIRKGHKFRILTEEAKKMLGIKTEKQAEQHEHCIKCLMKFSYFMKHNKPKCLTRLKNE